MFPIGVWMILHPPAPVIPGLGADCRSVHRDQASIKSPERLRAGNENVFSWRKRKTMGAEYPARAE